MYSLYDRDGVLRFANSDREACLDYAKLFELNSANCCSVSYTHLTLPTKA